MVQVACLPVEGYLNAVAWSADGSRLAALSGFGNQLTIWDAGTWSVDSCFPRYGGAYSGNSLAFLADDSLLLPAPIGRSPDPPYRELYLTSFEQIDATTGKRIRYVEDKFYDRGRRRIMETFAVAGGSSVVGIPTGNPSLISLFETKPWALKKNFDVSEGDPRYGYARSLSLSADGRTLAVGTANGRLKTFDTPTGEPLLERDFSPTSHAVSATAFSRDGRYLAVGRTRNYASGSLKMQMLHVLEADTLEDVGFVPSISIENVFSLAWGPDQALAIAASNVMEVGRIETDGSLTSFGTRMGRDFYSVVFSPAGQLAVAKGSTVLVYDF